MATQYTIYGIVNTITGQMYVGATTNPIQRKASHFTQLRTQKHPNSKLQEAFNRFGQSVFEFQILETEIEERFGKVREVYWIAHHDSYRKGYNMTMGDTVKTTPIVWNGKQYENIEVASRELRVSVPRLERWIKNGYVRDMDVVTNITSGDVHSRRIILRELNSTISFWRAHLDDIEADKELQTLMQAIAEYVDNH